MIELKVQYPYISEDGEEHRSLEKHYAVDENGKRYYILQVETGFEYAEAVDVVPCRYTYAATDKVIIEN